MRYLRKKVGSLALTGTATVLGGFAILGTACGDTNIEDDNTVTNPTATPVVEVVQLADDPTPAAGTGDEDCTPFDSGNSDNHVNEGVTVPAGSCAIWEEYNGTAKTDKLRAGKLDRDFTVSSAGATHMNAWGMSSYDQAIRDFCTSLVTQRLADNPDFTFDIAPSCDDDETKGGNTPAAGTTPTAVVNTPTPKPAPIVTPAPSLTGIRLTGECTGAIPHSDQNGPIKSGWEVPAGTLVVVRFVNHDDDVIYVESGCLLTNTIAGGIGMISIDIWAGFSKPLKASEDACGESYARLQGSRIKGSWEYLYDVFLVDTNGTFAPAPEFC